MSRVSNLGNARSWGIGVPDAYFEAAKWFRKAAEQGQADDQYGTLYVGKAVQRQLNVIRG